MRALVDSVAAAIYNRCARSEPLLTCGMETNPMNTTTRRHPVCIFVGAFLAAWSFLFSALVWGANEKIIFGWSAITGAQAVPWITKDAGLFEKNGLDTTLLFLDGGSKAIQTLLSGEVPVVVGAGNSAVAARVRGADVTMIAGLVNNLAYSLITNPDIKRPEDLRGKKLAISRYGANSDYATRKILLKWGLRPDRDVAIIQIPGGQPTRLATLQNGQVAGLVAQPPVTNLARKLRLNILAEPEDFGGEYTQTPIASTRLVAKERKETLRKFMKALVEGIHVYKTQKDFSKRVIAKYMRVNDIEAIDDSYQFFSRLVPSKPYIPINAIKEVLLELGEKDPKVAALKPEEFADMSFVKELDESGFIDGLYKGKGK